MRAPVASVVTLVAIVAIACATQAPSLTWKRADGTPATRAELEAAKQECLASTPSSPDPAHPRAQHQAYGQQVIQCIQSKGYQLVDESTP